MKETKGPCDGCDCAPPTCPCVCVCTPCNCLCITKQAILENRLDLNLDSVIALRRIHNMDLALLAAVLDANATVDIYVPGHRALDTVSIEVVGGTLKETLEQLGLLYK